MNSAQTKSEPCGTAPAPIEREARAFLDGAQPATATLPAPVSAGGRPTLYSDDLADRLFELIVDGADFSNVKGQGIPNRATLFRWKRDNPDFREMMEEAERARGKARAERYLAEVHASVMELDQWRVKGVEEGTDGSGNDVTKETRPFDEVGLGYLDKRIETLIALMKKHDPRLYGEPPPIAMVAAPAPGAPRLVGEGSTLAEQFGKGPVIEGFRVAAKAPVKS